MRPTTSHTRDVLVRLFAALVVAGAFGLPLATAAVAHAAEGSGLPGMCTGRSDPNLVINAQTQEGTKYVLEVATDADGHPTGALVLGQGPGRLFVDQFCRAWQHLPGQPAGECGDATASTTAHAVGIAEFQGERVLVRTDVRRTDEGASYRLRYRPLDGQGATASETEGGGCSDEGWIRVPPEGWAPLHHLKVRNV